MMSQRVILALTRFLIFSLMLNVLHAPTSAEEVSEEEDLLQEELAEEAQDIQEESGSSPSEGEDLNQQARVNTNAIKKLAAVMNNLVQGSATQRCSDSGIRTHELISSIQEGFSILVGAVQGLNHTMRHFKEEIEKKAFGTEQESPFQDGPCPSPFFQAGDDCIYIETEHLRYFDAARQACLDMGAKLAEFSSFQPFINAVDQMDIHEDAEIYIGVTDNERNNRWMTLTGTRVTNIPWGSGEPNGGSGENCVALRPTWKKFNDIRCSLRREYVCKWTA